jgi:hypothetical protein
MEHLAPGDHSGAAYVSGTLWALREAGVRFTDLASGGYGPRRD